MFTYRNQRTPHIDPLLSGMGSCGKLGMGGALQLKAQPFVKEVSNVISCRPNMLHSSTTRQDAIYHRYLSIQINYWNYYIDLDSIRLEFQEMVPCGKTRSPQSQQSKSASSSQNHGASLIQHNFYLETHLFLLLEDLFECLCWPSPSAPVAWWRFGVTRPKYQRTNQQRWRS